MKLARGLTVLVLASGLASGLAVGATDDDSGTFGIQDAQTGHLQWAEPDMPTEATAASHSEAAPGIKVVREPQAHRQHEQHSSSASQFEPMG